MCVFNQVFVFDEYAPFRNLPENSLVLDLGANVGYSSVYFLSFLPKSRVLAIEPDERNLAICRLNLQPFGDRVGLVHGAAWNRRTRLSLSRLSYHEGGEWATQVVENPKGFGGDVEAWDVLSLIETSGWDRVDLLKVDIERGELAVFDGNAKSWLPRVRNICIELHGQDCERVFFRALADFDYELEYSGELTVCRSLRPKRGSALASTPKAEEERVC